MFPTQIYVSANEISLQACASIKVQPVISHSGCLNEYVAEQDLPTMKKKKKKKKSKWSMDSGWKTGGGLQMPPLRPLGLKCSQTLRFPTGGPAR